VADCRGKREIEIRHAISRHERTMAGAVDVGPQIGDRRTIDLEFSRRTDNVPG
jgi:hypothetical protein